MSFVLCPPSLLYSASIQIASIIAWYALVMRQAKCKNTPDMWSLKYKGGFDSFYLQYEFPSHHYRSASGAPVVWLHGLSLHNCTTSTRCYNHILIQKQMSALLLCVLHTLPNTLFTLTLSISVVENQLQAKASTGTIDQYYYIPYSNQCICTSGSTIVVSSSTYCKWGL